MPVRSVRCALGKKVALALLFGVWALPALSLEIPLPDGALVVRTDPPEPGGFAVATGPWNGATVPIEDLAGHVTRTTWTMPVTDTATVSSVAEGITTALVGDGYDITFSCSDRTCGGFDFRQRVDLGRSPEMFVDIGNFHYSTAVQSGATVAITVSRGSATLFVHAAYVSESNTQSTWVTPSTRTPEDGIEAADLSDDNVVERIANLPAYGAVTLEDLRFQTGASQLSGRDYPSLLALSEFLADNPERRVVLVGHTDTLGRLEGNIALSEARAAAVRAHLVIELGVDPGQVEATGIGYLAPRGTNETAEGREENRRVDAVLLSTE